MKSVSTTFTISKTKVLRIGINTRFLLTDKMEGFGWYTYEISKRIVEMHPEHEFVFFFDRPYDPKFVFGKNVTPVILSPAARHPLLFIFWFNFLIPKALRKYKIDIFFSPDGYLSLRTKIPQVATIHDINFEHYPEDIPVVPRIYLRKYFPKFAKQASHILTVSEYSKKDIASTYSINSDKISSIWNGVSPAFKQLDSEQIVQIRDHYSNGNAYFVFVGSIHPRKNLTRLIEAFKHYCENQENDWNLLIVGESMWGTSNNLNIPESLKDRILFTGRLDQEELAIIVGAAGALTFVPYFEGFGIPLVEAMKCGVPILSGDKTSLPEIAGDAAIYCDPFDVESIAEGLFKISKNQELRIELGKKGLKRSELFNWDKAASDVWQVIEKVIIRD